ncbi:AMP-binding protein [Chryseobacterium sp. MFBS3-17]|uniref:AMP-binding protein n=1 Tax=Chryseobacterium sp. MFBS3-17 TaxID=2886689 RepID=UPI001D0E3CF4|nr:AMP-binding protein [Chryseobacterium sp. MFBS3-17]MCC2590711.1 AMP-binding protein [Chryseobacterium sp. MFBS3-17]
MRIDFKNLNMNNLQPKDVFGQKVYQFIEEWHSPGKTVSVQTSGSTGVPKIFQIEKEKMKHSARMTCDFLGLNPGNTALLCLPVEYISGKMMVVRAMERNLMLHVRHPSLQPLEGLQDEIDFCAMTPLQVEHSLEQLHLIKNLIIGGAQVLESLIARIEQQSGCRNPAQRIFETYGMSETLSHIGLKEIYPNRQDYFTVFEGIEIGLDERGCLKINAPQLNPEVLLTNDLVELRNEKQFRFLGRTDHIINSGGAKIFPEQLEALVRQKIPGEALFIGADDEVLGHKLVLVIEGFYFSEDEIREKLKTVPFEKSFHHPKEIIFVKEIPRTPNGKVNRNALRNIIRDL